MAKGFATFSIGWSQVTNLEQVYLRGSQIRYFILPDMFLDRSQVCFKNHGAVWNMLHSTCWNWQLMSYATNHLRWLKHVAINISTNRIAGGCGMPRCSRRRAVAQGAASMALGAKAVAKVWISAGRPSDFKTCHRISCTKTPGTILIATPDSTRCISNLSFASFA